MSNIELDHAKSSIVARVASLKPVHVGDHPELIECAINTAIIGKLRTITLITNEPELVDKIVTRLVQERGVNCEVAIHYIAPESRYHDKNIKYVADEYFHYLCNRISVFTHSPMASMQNINLHAGDSYQPCTIERVIYWAECYLDVPSPLTITIHRDDERLVGVAMGKCHPSNDALVDIFTTVSNRGGDPDLIRDEIIVAARRAGVWFEPLPSSNDVVFLSNIDDDYRVAVDQIQRCEKLIPLISNVENLTLLTERLKRMIVDAKKYLKVINELNTELLFKRVCHQLALGCNTISVGEALDIDLLMKKLRGLSVYDDTQLNVCHFTPTMTPITQIVSI